MKVFWSWQSDLPGKTNRHFVREALEESITSLKQSSEIEEPMERERREAMHLDYDRKGVPGSPDLVRTILKKIDASSIFIADVTPVSELERPGEDGNPEIKKNMNPNVAIELGYALKSLGDESILMVTNKQYGGRRDLPFDLAHKAGPIFYDLPPTAKVDQIAKQKKLLVGHFKAALKPYLDERPSDNSKRKFKETKPQSRTKHFFEPGESLAWMGQSRDHDRTDYKFQADRYFYLRVFPTEPASKPFKRAELSRLAHERCLPTFQTNRQIFSEQNRYGVIMFEPTSPTTDQLNAVTQVFKTGELWGLNRKLFVDFNGKAAIPIVLLDETLEFCLSAYVRFLKEALGFSLPFQVEFGAEGLQGCGLGIKTNAAPEFWELYDHRLSKRISVDAASNDHLDKIRRTFLEEVFGITTHDIPDFIGN